MKIGDKVKVKSYDEILDFGKLDEDGDIRLSDSCFMKEMTIYCEKEDIIQEVENGLFLLKDVNGWYFSPQVLEKIKNSEEIDKMKEKYVILDIRSGELVIEDYNPYFNSLEDAQDYVLECEESPQLLNILEVSKVFECELNFKTKAL